MNEKIKVLIAEDTRIARDLLTDSLKNFSENNYEDAEFFIIDKAESFQKANQKIVESAQTGNYYDLIFMDIDFTEDGHGGRRDSGYELIEKAFEISPLSKIATYSGQFRAAELWPKYEELKNRGLIVYTFDKSHGEAGEENWMDAGLEKLIKEIIEHKILWKIWEAHKLISNAVKGNRYYTEAGENLLLQNSIMSNLDSALMLLMNAERLENKELVYRMAIYIYHNSLESVCRAGKADDLILSESDNNKISAEKFISEKAGKEIKFNFPNSVNSQRIFVSAVNDERIKFVDTLNHFRNKSIHPDENFRLDISNVLFSVLTFALVVIPDKKEIELEQLKTFLSESKDLLGRNNLQQLIDFIEN